VSCTAEVCCKIVHEKVCTKGRKSKSNKIKEKELNTNITKKENTWENASLLGRK
jgi:hypothetical protein